MTKENMLRAALATKQLEIDKLKLKIKEMENNDRQRDTKNRKKDKRIEPSNVSDK